MTYGVKINGTDLKASYGLILLSDLQIGAPKMQENYVEVPGRDGALNMSYAVDGYPHFKSREISFSMFSRKSDLNLQQTRDALVKAYHGREVDLILPMEANFHFHGVLQIGGISGFNTGTIGFSMLANPWRVRNAETTVAKNIGTTPMEITLENDDRPVVPDISATVACEIAMGSKMWQIGAGDHVIPDLVLMAGDNELTVSASSSGTITFEWTGAKL